MVEDHPIPSFHTFSFILLGVIVLTLLLITPTYDTPLVHGSGGPTISNIQPTDGDRIDEGLSVTISFFITGRGTKTVNLYLARGREPIASDRVDHQEGDISRYSFSLPSSELDVGTYYWYATASDSMGTTTIALKSFSITPLPEEPLPVEVDETSPSSGSISGGKGGHQSEAREEKTGFFIDLSSGKSIGMTLTSKVPIHRIRKLSIRALDPLEGGNAFLIHQEFEKHFLSHLEEGVVEAQEEGKEEAVHPFFYALPSNMIPYKAIHIHPTHEWEGKRFWSTIEFEVSKEWMNTHDLKRPHIAVQALDEKNGTWKWMNVWPVSDEIDVYAYRVTLEGMPPFLIGGSESSFYGARIAPKT